MRWCNIAEKLCELKLIWIWRVGESLKTFSRWAPVIVHQRKSATWKSTKLVCSSSNFQFNFNYFESSNISKTMHSSIYSSCFENPIGFCKDYLWWVIRNGELVHSEDYLKDLHRHKDMWKWLLMVESGQTVVDTNARMKNEKKWIKMDDGNWIYIRYWYSPLSATCNLFMKQFVSCL